MKLRKLLAVSAITLALALSACGGGAGDGGDGDAGETAETTITVGTDTGAELQFVPNEVSAPANTAITLVFNNESDSQPHNLTFQDGPITAATETNVPPGESETLEFTTPGPGDYSFVCTIHPGMDGTLHVQ